MDLRGRYPNLKNNLGDFMYRFLKIIFVIISLNFTYSETISGKILDNRTGEPLIGANVIFGCACGPGASCVQRLMTMKKTEAYLHSFRRTYAAK